MGCCEGTGIDVDELASWYAGFLMFRYVVALLEERWPLDSFLLMAEAEVIPHG